MATDGDTEFVFKSTTLSPQIICAASWRLAADAGSLHPCCSPRYSAAFAGTAVTATATDLQRVSTTIATTCLSASRPPTVDWMSMRMRM
jgi:hypothetical protein